MQAIETTKQITAKGKRLWSLVSIMVAIRLLIGGTTPGLLYQTAFGQYRDQLTDIAKNQSSMINAIAKFDREVGHSVEAKKLLLSQIRTAHENFKDFGSTGEYVLGELVGDNITFPLIRRHGNYTLPEPIPIWMNYLIDHLMDRWFIPLFNKHKRSHPWQNL